LVGSQELGGARALLELLRSSVHKETVRASALNKDQKDVCALAHREVRDYLSLRAGAAVLFRYRKSIPHAVRMFDTRSVAAALNTTQPTEWVVWRLQGSSLIGETAEALTASLRNQAQVSHTTSRSG